MMRRMWTWLTGCYLDGYAWGFISRTPTPHMGLVATAPNALRRLFLSRIVFIRVALQAPPPPVLH